MEFEHEANDRFYRIKFQDAHQTRCSVTKARSSSMAKICFGVDDPQAKIMGLKGWEPAIIPNDVVLSTRMHLSQSQVYDLLPLLAFFAEHGVLPAEYAKANPVKMIEAAMGDRRLIHEEILRIGQQLSNAAHALKQDSSIDERTRQTMADLQKRWDEAYSAWYRVPGKPKQNSGTS